MDAAEKRKEAGGKKGNKSNNEGVAQNECSYEKHMERTTGCD